jgi:hypothetical protein
MLSKNWRIFQMNNLPNLLNLHQKKKKQKQNPKIIVQKATNFVQKMVMDGC